MLSNVRLLAPIVVLLFAAGCDSPAGGERRLSLGSFAAETDGEFYGTSLSGIATIERGDSHLVVILRDESVQIPSFPSPAESYVFLRRAGGLPAAASYPVGTAFEADSTAFGAGWTIGTAPILPDPGVLGGSTGTVRITEATSRGIRGEMEIVFRSSFGNATTTMRGRFYARFE